MEADIDKSTLIYIKYMLFPIKFNNLYYINKLIVLIFALIKLWKIITVSWNLIVIIFFFFFMHINFSQEYATL